MKNLKSFQNAELKKVQTNSIFGGRTSRDTERYESGVNCTDCHEDTNDNGLIDAGECVTLEVCD